jgi:hypothetical protein
MRNMWHGRRGPLVPILLGVFGLALGIWVTSSLLADNEWNPSVFIKFPTISVAETAYGEAMLGEVIPAGGLGHDGKYYFMQAMDPFYLDPEQHAILLDRPTYRAQRMVYPTLASGFGTLPAPATAWSMLVVNLVALGIGTWLTALLAQQLGISAWFGLAFLLNPGVLVSAFIDTADLFALVFLLAGALFVLRERTGLAVAFLTLSALSRETMILATVGVMAYLWHTRRRVPIAYVVPFAATAAWWLYVRARLAGLESGLQDTQALGLPFKGFYEAFQIWLSTPGAEVDMMMGILLLVASILVAGRALKNRSLLGLMTAGFGLIAVLMVEPVWRFYFDASRALIPVVTVYVLTVAASRRAFRTRSDLDLEPEQDQKRNVARSLPAS